MNLGIRVSCLTPTGRMALEQHFKEVEADSLGSKRKRLNVERYRNAMSEVKVSDNPLIYEFLWNKEEFRKNSSYAALASKVRDMMFKNDALEGEDYVLEEVV